MRQQYAKNAPIPSMRQQYATGVTPTLLNSRPREIRSIGMSADKDGNASDFSSDDYLDDDAYFRVCLLPTPHRLEKRQVCRFPGGDESGGGWQLEANVFLDKRIVTA